jgi:predicted MPP superfamily phosphohydrolase
VSLTGPLRERQLYDVALAADTGWRTVAPHAMYYRRVWHDFGIAHITDAHVARRIDRFRPTLYNLGRPEAAARMYNWNDRFRGFVRYANYLHDIGALDVILATGDMYDYQFEYDDDGNGQGNALFLRELLLGRAPGPDFPDVEELRVPIFMVPGNHDYRMHPTT